MLVLITQEKHLPEILLGMGLDLGYTIQNGPLEIEFHHHADSLRQARVHTDRKIERADLAVFDQARKTKAEACRI